MKVKKWKLASFLLPCLLLFAGGVFKFIGLDNYINAFRNDARMLTALKNTGIWVVLQSVVHVMLGTVIAFMLSKRKKGWKVLRTIYMIPNVVSAAALAVIFLNVFNAQYGIINSFVKTVTGKPFMKNWFFDQNSAFITVTWSWLLYTGMIIILVLAGVLSIPEDVVEAAKIDGATDMQINMKIRLPLIRTIIGTCEILAATSMLREFELIYLTTNGGPGDTTLNLPLYLYKTSMTDNNYGYANMMGVILIIAGVIVVSAINRLFKMNEADY